MPLAVSLPPAPRRAAFTIVSSDRVAAARLLAGQYRKFHPEQPFFTVIADDLSRASENRNDVERIPLGAIALPDPHVFPYQHGMRALCAAVKPFCARHLLGFDDVDQLFYLDADIGVYRRLDDVSSALDRNNVVLTPHSRRPVEDAATPSDQTFLQRGLFNSGFVGMKDHAATAEFLDWWCERVYAGCPGRPDAGLYLDQKWLDLAPEYFQGVHVLNDDTCNVAYWNLHERTLTGSRDGYLVNGRPLGFYHFSGFDPARPDVLSTHQSRYHLSEMPVLKSLHDAYAQALRDAGGADLRPLGQACVTLGNGVPMSRLASAVVLHCIQNGIAFPAPGTHPHAFCDFLTTPNSAVFGTDVAPLVTALLDARPDVASAFPAARHDKHDPGLRHWLATCGGEEHLETLLRDFGANLRRCSGLARALQIHRRRKDLQEAFPEPFLEGTSFVGYGQWLDTHGRGEDGVEDDVVSEYLAAPKAAWRVIQQYFSHPELWSDFPLLHPDKAIAALVERIALQIGNFSSLDATDLLAFEAVANARRDDLVLACLRYNPRVRDQIGGEPSLLNAVKIESFLARHDALHAVPDVINALRAGHWITPPNQLRAFLHADPSAASGRLLTAAELGALLAPARFLSEKYQVPDHASQWEDWIDDALRTYTDPLRPGVNLHGPLHDATGMGEWARSLPRIFDAAGIAHRCVALPTRFPTPGNFVDAPLPSMFGAVHDRLDVNLIVANADAVNNTRDWLPAHVLAERCNVGCWIWETEALPRRFVGSSRGLDAIITPSDYSAEAIRKTVDIPVYTVPCALNLAGLDAASPNRAGFGLPEEAMLFGFFFDAKSIIERKNPIGLIDAFRCAFGTRSDVGLVLKVNSPTPGNYEYEMLKSRAHDLNVIWIERTMSTKDTLDLMASIDVYVSLHRSEGFGLTLAEALAMGKPVIATGYSGNLEFMDSASACLVDYKVSTTTRAHGPYPLGSRWAEPSIEHCAYWMRALAAGQLHATVASAGRSRVRHALSPERVAGQMQATLARIRYDWHAGADPP